MSEVSLYALVCIDPSTDVEDVVIGQLDGVAIPMVAPRPEMIAEAGANMAKGTGLRIRLVKFVQDEEVEVFLPDIEVPDDLDSMPDERVLEGISPEELDLDGSVD